MLKLEFKKYVLKFKLPAGTSRGVLTEKPTWFLKIWDTDSPGQFGIGECSILPGLSIDDRADFEQRLIELSAQLSTYDVDSIPALSIGRVFDLTEFPSIIFGLETAVYDLKNGGSKNILSDAFVSGTKKIPINGLVWMGDEYFMLEQVAKKMEEGYSCLKLKVGAIDFEKECMILESIRKKTNASKLMLRLDANGAFTSSNVFDRLSKLNEYDIHSIEQPVKAGQKELMKKVCEESLIPIALDEELIGVVTQMEKQLLLEYLAPHYIILKPSLIGGITSSLEWIDWAKQLNIGFWFTSALESNIGLNAIAQLAEKYGENNLQGLGTGQLYHNNIASPLLISNGHLTYDSLKSWENPL